MCLGITVSLLPHAVNPGGVEPVANLTGAFAYNIIREFAGPTGLRHSPPYRYKLNMAARQ